MKREDLVEGELYVFCNNGEWLIRCTKDQYTPSYCIKGDGKWKMGEYIENERIKNSGATYRYPTTSELAEAAMAGFPVPISKKQFSNILIIIKSIKMGKETAKKASNLSVAVMDDVPSVLDVLNKKIAELAEIETTVWKTSGNLEGFGDIKKEKLIPNLGRALASVMIRADGYRKAMEEGLGLTSYEVFSIGGTVEDWTHDIQLQMKIINHKETYDTLLGFKDKASKFLSEQDQKAMLFKEMEAFLKKQ